MPREIVTITHGSGGIRLSFGSDVRGFANVEYLAEAFAQAVLTERANQRQTREIRDCLKTHEKMPTISDDAKGLISDIRKILDIDMPF